MTTPTEIRACLAQNDYVPIPVNGKAAVLDGWAKRTETSQGDLDIWAKLYSYAKNTGILCTHCPTLDIDVLDPDAVDAAVRLVHERFEGRGRIMLRYGLRPKVAILFRTDVPFDKIKVLLTAPDGSTGQKIELLCRGQQVVVHGIHPDTHAPYQWLDGTPSSVKRDELPPITEAEAQTLVNDVVALMLSHGYQIAEEGERKRKGNGADHDDMRADWGSLYENIRIGRDYHDSLRDLACKMVAAGTDPGAVVNILRDLMKRSEAPHDDERWQSRYDDIPRLVDGAVELLSQAKAQDVDAEVTRLAELSRLEYEQERKRVARKLGIRAGVLDELVEVQRAQQKAKRKVPPPNPTQPVPNGVDVLALTRDYLKKYVAYPNIHALVAHTLLCAHTHLLDAFDSTPRGAFLSPFPGSGKTRALEVSGPLVCRLVSTVNPSANYLFRKAGDPEGPPTVLFDEIDTFFGAKAREHEEHRGFINAGHRKGATYGRCRVVGNSVETEDSPVYAAVMMAGLGWLPDTILSRSVVIRMHRRLESEKVAQFRGRTSIPEGKAIGAQLAAWAMSVFDDAAAARPEMPEGVEDRAADVWEPLLVVADLVGGEWPTLAREAAVAFVKADSQTPPSTKFRLLRDSRQAFWENLKTVAATRPKGLITDTLMDALCNLDDSPWKTINKAANGAREPFTTVELAKHMFDFGVEPTHLRPFPNDDTQRRGYPLAPLAEAWRRYLPPLLLGRKAVTAVTPVTREVLDEYFAWVLVDDDGKPVTEPVTPVTGVTGFEPKRDGQETAETGAPEPVPNGEKGADQEVPAPDGEDAQKAGTPNFAKVLDRPFEWSPFDAESRKRR
jgi:hypothetical protein